MERANVRMTFVRRSILRGMVPGEQKEGTPSHFDHYHLMFREES